MASALPHFASAHLDCLLDSRPVVPQHFHCDPARWSLYILHTGGFCFQSGGGTYLAGGGDVLLLPPGVCHALLPGGGDTHMTTLLFSAPAGGTAPQGCLLFSMRAHPDIDSLLHLVRDLSLLPAARDQLLAALLLQLAALPELHIAPLHPFALPMQILSYLDENFRDDVSLTGLAALFHFTPSHIIHVFQPLYDLSPIQYLKHRRIGEAQHLLRTTEHSASAIAGMVGIYNRNYFYSTFKKMVGMSPGDYRSCSAFGLE